jgi:hypothetical protein
MILMVEGLTTDEQFMLRIRVTKGVLKGWSLCLQLLHDKLSCGQQGNANFL